MDYMEKDEKDVVFVAFCRLLLRSLKLIKGAVEEGDIEVALSRLDELISDTERDIE